MIRNSQTLCNLFIVHIHCAFAEIFFFPLLKTYTEIQFTGAKTFSVTHRVSAYINSPMVQLHSLKVTHKKKRPE